MPEPLKPKKGNSENLHEVERARRARSRRIVVIGTATAILLVLVLIGVFQQRETSRRERINDVYLHFVGYGFRIVETSLRGSTGFVEATVEPGCMLAVSTSDEPVTIVSHQGSNVAAPSSLFCTCTKDRIAITSPVGGQGGIALLRTDTANIGGSRAFPFTMFKPTSTLVLDEPCKDASLDAWIALGNQPYTPPEGDWFAAAPARAPLKVSGFRVIDTGEADVPFVVTNVPEEYCIVATSTVDEPISFRRPGDVSPLAEGAQSIGRCAQSGAKLIVAHGGKGVVTVLWALARWVGGSVGLREVTAQAGLRLSTVALAGADRPWDAKQFLLSSSIVDGTVTTASAPVVVPRQDARIVALSLETAHALVGDWAPDVHSACSPPIDDDTRETLCIFSGPQRWRSPGTGEGAVGGLARAELPSWIYSMHTVKDPAALAGLVKLVGLARALARQGFRPTTIYGLTERPNGVEVLGGDGEDAVVAVGVGPSEPWVYPLSEDATWDLDGAPPIAMVKPAQKVMLVTTIKKLPALPTRRTVVFRRQVAATSP